jgi:hypothetical protein
MTAALSTTSFGSSQYNNQVQQSSRHSSPLKRSHSDQQELDEYRAGHDEQSNRPIKKIRVEGQEADGIVSRLWKYAWQLIAAPEGKHR